MTEKEALTFCRILHFSLDGKARAFLELVQPGAGADYFFDECCWNLDYAEAIKKRDDRRKEVGMFFMSVGAALVESAKGGK